MKKPILKKNWIIIIFIVIIVIPALPFIWAAITPYPTFIYTSPTDKNITVWRNKYIVFDKYDRNKPPQKNCIEITSDYYYIYVCFKTNDSIYIWSSKENIKYNFNEVYRIKPYYGYGEQREIFDNRTRCADSSVVAKYYFDNDEPPYPIFSEIVGDSIYQRRYFTSFNFNINPTCRYNDYTFSRYDEALNK